MSTLRQDIGLRLHLANMQDLDRLVAIEEASFSAPWSRRAFEAELIGNEFSTILVARTSHPSEHDQEMLGYICVWIVFDELRFMNLAVAPDARRQGIGKWLVRQALDLGRSRGTKRALLEVRESNDAARSLYSSLGFSTYGRRKSYYTNKVEDAILMNLDFVTIVTESM